MSMYILMTLAQVRSEGVGHGLGEFVNRPHHAPGRRDSDPRLGVAVVNGIRLAG
ncbi:hypothetical protein ACWIGN_31975 [Streptomyces albidoflavus]